MENDSSESGDERTCLQLLVPTIPELLPFVGIERMLFGILFVLFELIFKIFDRRIPQVSAEFRLFSKIFEIRKNERGKGEALWRGKEAIKYLYFSHL